MVVPEWFKNQVSSTSVREAVRQGQCIGMIVPMNVADFIEEERIYLEDPSKLVAYSLTQCTGFPCCSFVGTG